MGLLDGQSARAARVVLDITACAPPGPRGKWAAANGIGTKPWAFFSNHVSMDEGSARYEVNRYFGWARTEAPSLQARRAHLAGAEEAQRPGSELRP